MSVRRQQPRRDQRKFKRIFVRYGNAAPEHSAIGQQISASGIFLLTNDIVYAKGTPILVEFRGPAETWVAAGIVRHAIKVHPNMARFTNPGMGVELTEVPPACRTYLASL